MIISNAAIGNRVTVAVLVFLISIAGVYSYARLPRETPPDVPIPYIMISTPYQGVSPEDIETSVTMKIEKKLTGIKGVKEIRSSSMEGFSMIMVEFQPDVRIEDALQYVRDKADQARMDLPPEADATTVQEINIAEFPIMLVNISGSISPVALKDIGDKLEDAIEQNVPGVLNVDVLGGLEREIRIEIDPDRVDMYGLTVPEVLKLIPSENVNISAGGLETTGTKFNVRVPAEFRSAQDIKDIEHLVLCMRQSKTNPLESKTIYLGDVAQVRDTFKDRESISRVNGASSITIAIQKRVGANIIEISQAVNKILDEAKKRSPAGVSFSTTMDRCEDINRMVADLENNIGAALVLVIAVLLVTIGLRASIVVALAVPLSMLMSFAVIELMGYTLNMVVLFSLVLAVGMLVDDAIVIVENIYRHMQLGYNRIDAAIKGAAEVAWPVITSTLTTVAAFFPLIFWPGLMGSFMKFLPITVIIVLLSSLFVALVVSPVVCTVVPGKAHSGVGRHPILQVYRRVLRFALGYRRTTMILCLLVLVGMGWMYAKVGRGLEFFPANDPKHGIINIRAPQGTNINESDRLARVVEDRLKEHWKDMKYVVTSVGSSGGGGGAAAFTGASGGPNIGNLTLVFPDYEIRTKPSADTIVEIRGRLKGIAGADIKVEKEQMGPPAGSPVTVRISGQDLKELEKLNNQAMKLIADVPGLVNLRSDLELTRPELVYRVDRNRAIRSGVNTMVVGNFLKTAVYGAKVGTFRQYNDEYDITVRMPENRRTSIDDVYARRVPNNVGAAIPLSSLGKFEYAGGLGTVNRVNQKRVMTITADAEGRLDTEVLADVQEILSPQGRNRLIAADVRDWNAFMAALHSSSGPGKRIMDIMGKMNGVLGAWAGGKLSPTFAKALDAAQANGGELTPRQKDDLLAGVNEVLKLDDFYNPNDMPGIALTEEGQELVNRQQAQSSAWYSFMPKVVQRLLNRQGQLKADEILRLNRLVLEGAWGNLLAPTQKLGVTEGYEVKYAGQNDEMQSAMSFLSKAFIIALILITLIMVAQFNTLSVPLVIMSTVVLSLIGVLIGLMTCNLPFGIIMTGIGVISLAGVVVKNGIVLMDFTRKLQERGMSVMDACVEAGTIRLRPVLLTATCTVLGLVPTALGMSFDFHTFEWVTKSESSQMWRSMAVALIFGLTFATMLTLVVVPSMYVTLYRFAARFGMGGIKTPVAVAQEQPPQPAEGAAE